MIYYKHLKLLMAVIICNQIYFFTYDEGQRRGHSKKLYKKCSRLDLRKYVFSNRVIDRWNALSDVCVTSNTIN